MTVADVVKPDRWDPWIRWVAGGLLMAVVTVFGSAIVQAYNFGVEREHQRGEFVSLKNQIDGVKTDVKKATDDQAEIQKSLQTAHTDATDAARTAAQVAKDLADGRARTLPRIDKLEDAVNKIVPDLATIKQTVVDIKDTTKSHDSDIKAIRGAVAPRDGDRNGR